MKLWGNKEGKEKTIAGFLDHGTNFTGELQFSGIVRIDGNFHGSINSGDTLIVGANAVIHADIRVGEIEIHGHVFGTVETGRAEIHSSGSFRGDLSSPILVTHEGAIFDGHSHMISESGIGPLYSESTRIVPRERHQRPSVDRDPEER